MTGASTVGIEREAWRHEPVRPLGGGRRPASVNQEVLWLRRPEVAADPAFTISTAVDLPGRVDEVALAEALAAVVDHQPTLRTAFEADEDGRFHQRFDGPPPTLDRTSMPAGADRAALTDVLSDYAARPFAVFGGPLTRLHLVQQGGDRATLEVVFHHAVTDWVSTQTFIGELLQAYRSLTEGTAPAFEPLPVDYGDFAGWERDLLDRGAWDDDIAHWRDRIVAPPEPLWPDGRGAGVERLDLRADRMAFTVDDEVAAGLQQRARRERVTMFMTVLGLYQVLLHCHSGREDLAVGIPASARPRPEVASLMGYFLNLVPLRGDLSGNPTVSTLLRRVRAATVDDMARATVATGALYDRLAPGADVWRSLPFQARLIFLSSHEATQDRSASLTDADVQCGGIPYDLTLALWAVGGSMFGRFDYRTAVFDDQEIAVLVDDVKRLLAIFAAGGDPTLSDLRAAVRPHPTKGER